MRPTVGRLLERIGSPRRGSLHRSHRLRGILPKLLLLTSITHGRSCYVRVMLRSLHCGRKRRIEHAIRPRLAQSRYLFRLTSLLPTLLSSYQCNSAERTLPDDISICATPFRFLQLRPPYCFRRRFKLRIPQPEEMISIWEIIPTIRKFKSARWSRKSSFTFATVYLSVASMMI